ncbi:MAG: adenylate/guanylate cyclase domain-containing protein [Leptospiraceae bacterium]|nr:adenylate/guanylate cyclase domain-containing protein [Leptospiraceae bacterium]
MKKLFGPLSLFPSSSILVLLLGILVGCESGSEQQGMNRFLSGPWKLYREELCISDCSTEPLQEAPLLIPEDWNVQYGTYVMDLELPPELQDSSLGILMFDVGSAYRVYVNDRLIAESGIVGPSPEVSRPDVWPRHFFFSGDAKIRLVVQFSNFVHPRGGLRKAPYLGSADAVQNFRDRTLLRNLIPLGLILGMAIYHFGLFLSRRSDTASLLFALVCLTWSIRMLFSGENTIRLLWNPGYELQTDIEYISFILAGPLFVAFLAHAFEFRGSKWMAWANVAVGLLACLTVIAFPVRIYASYLWAYHIVVLFSVISSVAIWVVAIVQKQSGAYISLSGGLVACLAAINDLLFYQGRVPIGPIFHYGFLVFILAQSYLLARLFARTYEGVIQLSESLKNTNTSLARFVPREFLKILDRTNITEVRLGDQVQQNMTVMFTDIRSFTTLSEQMSPEENFNFLNSYLRRMTPLVNNAGGFVDKYIGDAVMALFPGKPDDALRAAIEMQREIRVYNRHRALKGYQPISIGIGIHTGEIMLGIIGHENRMEGTVISDTVNTGSRIERLTRKYGVMIIASDATVADLEHPEDFQLRLLGRVRVKGRKEALRIYHVLDGHPEDVRLLFLSTRERFDSAVENALSGRYQDAMAEFQAILDENPLDPAARFYLDRMNRAGVETS